MGFFILFWFVLFHGVTCEYCSSSNPALLWTSVTMTPGLSRCSGRIGVIEIKSTAHCKTHMFHLCFCFCFFQKKTLTTQSSLGPAYSPVLEFIHFYVTDNMTYKNAEQTKQGGLKEKEPTHRELCTVWTDRWPTLTCSTPARQGTGQKDTPQFSYLPHTMQGSNDHNCTGYDSESPKWCRRLVVKKKKNNKKLKRGQRKEDVR